ncbi:MAG: hypothetical protein AB7U83_20630 [Vicinamibacterales bacterium]
MTRGMAVRGFLTAMAIVIGGATSASAQVFGTFSWQMQPYCNTVTLTLTSVTGNFTLDGSDDMCGAAKKGSASGIGVFNPDGTVGLNFTIVLPTGNTVAVATSVSPANGQGTWSDDAGNSGTFAFFGATPGLPVRPGPQVHFRSGGIGAQAITGGITVITSFTGAPVENVGGGTFTPATGVYVVPRAGTYALTALVRWQPFVAAAGYYCSYIFTSGERKAVTCAEPSTTAAFLIHNLSTVVTLAAGDTVDIRAFNGSGGAGTVGSSSTETLFTVTRLH